MGAEDAFKKLGMGDYEARTLSALIKQKDLTAEEIADITEIPYTKVYNALTALENQKLIKSTLGRPKKYTSIGPDKIIKKIIQKKKDEYEKLKNKAEDSLVEIKTNIENECIETPEKTYYINSANTVWNEVEKMGKTAKKSIKVVADIEGWKEAYSRKSIIKTWYDAVIERNVLSENLFPKTMPFEFFMEESCKTPGFDPNKYYRKVKNYTCDENKIKHTIIIVDDEEIAIAFKNKNDQTHFGIIIKDKKVARGISDYFKDLKQTGEEVRGLNALILWLSSKSKIVLKKIKTQ